MIDYHKELLSILSKILPTYFELNLTHDVSVPCITYLELNDYEEYKGDTLGYSIIRYQIKVWSTKLSELQSYGQQIDNALRKAGWTRVNALELYDTDTAMKQKVFNYQARFREIYEGE